MIRMIFQDYMDMMTILLLKGRQGKEIFTGIWKLLLQKTYHYISCLWLLLIQFQLWLAAKTDLLHWARMMNHFLKFISHHSVINLKFSALNSFHLSMFWTQWQKSPSQQHKATRAFHWKMFKLGTLINITHRSKVAK